MGENSAIEWTDHTFNPWIGCTKVSPGCTNCYAEDMMDHRYHRVTWGKGKPRVRTSPANWKKPLAWDRACAEAGTRARVFCASLADVFDDEVNPGWRDDLFDLIEQCRNLDWLLLTKRPENAMRMLSCMIIDHDLAERFAGPWSHVWIGTTVEDQQRADERIPQLLAIPARVRFLSCEPLLGPVDLRAPLNLCPVKRSTINAHTGDLADHGWGWDRNNMRGTEWVGTGIHWVIAGGESGQHARPMHPAWLRQIRDQCHAARVSFLFKQWGEWVPTDQPWRQDNPARLAGNERYVNLAGGEGYHGEDVWRVRRVGKALAGRMLDGVLEDAVPVPA
jgi:protein gp37